MKLKSIFTHAVVGLSLAFNGLYAQKPKYDIAFVPNPGVPHVAVVTGMNNLGEVIGYYSPLESPYTSYAFLYYPNGTFVDLGKLDEHQTSSYPFGINDLGEVVGHAYKEPAHIFAFSYSNKKMINLNDVTNGQGFNFTSAYGINNAGQIVGVGFYPNSTEKSTLSIVLWNEKLIDIGMLGGPESAMYAMSINDVYDSTGLGQVAGVNTPYDSPSRTFVYSNGVLEAINYNNTCLLDFQPYQNPPPKINENGQVLSYCFPNHGFTVLTFLYDSQSEDVQYVGGQGFLGYDLNDNGQIVGMFANYSGSYGTPTPVLFMDKSIYNLYNLVPPNHNLTDFVPLAINSKGQILIGFDNHIDSAGAVLTPIDM